MRFCSVFFFFVSSRRRHTRCALVTGVQTCALPIWIHAPVLLFHGTLDQNVEIAQSKTMVRALKDAGRPVELVEYPGLAHSLGTAAARTDMLRRIDAFLAK